MDFEKDCRKIDKKKLLIDGLDAYKSSVPVMAFPKKVS